MDGLTVLVVDGEEQSRTRLLLCLRRLGLRALGVDHTFDAIALLEALDADVVLIHNDDDPATVAPVRRKSAVVQLPRHTPIDEVVVALLRALGRPEEAALIN